MLYCGVCLQQCMSNDDGNSFSINVVAPVRFVCVGPAVEAMSDVNPVQVSPSLRGCWLQYVCVCIQCFIVRMFYGFCICGFIVIRKSFFLQILHLDGRGISTVVVYGAIVARCHSRLAAHRPDATLCLICIHFEWVVSNGLSILCVRI